MKSYNGFSPAQRMQGDKILKEAIAAGEIPAPKDMACCLCGQTEGIKHYHNEDYSPEHVVDDARCLCWRCHMMLHVRYRHPLSYAKYMIEVAIYKKKYPPVFKSNDWQALEQHYID